MITLDMVKRGYEAGIINVEASVISGISCEIQDMNLRLSTYLPFDDFMHWNAEHIVERVFNYLKNEVKKEDYLYIEKVLNEGLKERAKSEEENVLAWKTSDEMVDLALKDFKGFHDIYGEATMNKRQICEDIGLVYGKFFVEDGLFCIDNDEKVFYYHSEDALLVDWLDTLLESHYNDYYIDEEGKIWDSWEEEIIFIYEEVIGKFPAGVRPVENKNGRTWESSVDLNDGSRHFKNLHLGTYSSIVDAIFARQKFLDQAAYINRNQPNFFDDYLALAAQIKADMQKVQQARVEIPDDYDNKPSLSEQIISASSRTGESQFIDKVSAKAPAPER